MMLSAKGALFSPMAHSIFPQSLRTYRPGPAAELALGLALSLSVVVAAIGSGRLIAQIEGERGIAPVASSTDIQVAGVEVNTTGKNAEEARAAGWKLAQRKAWEQVKGPAMSDEQIDAMVAAIVIEREQVGPRRYIARLGVIFDRAKAGQFIAAAQGGPVQRSAPLLVVPVLYSGGVSQVFEVRGPWQRAWANFATAASPIDYVRPAGAGGESLILTAGQTGRRSRLWWRTVLDQFGAADVIMPVARLERQWPGGPVKGTFTARYGPDNTFLESFTLTAKDEQSVPKMLNQALVRIDQIYAGALYRGLLQPDPTLVTDQDAFFNAMAAVEAATRARLDALPHTSQPATTAPSAIASQAGVPVAARSYVVQFASPDAAAVDAALAAVRGAPGVQSAATSSLAIGGTSVMRVTMAGDLDSLATALRARGWQVSAGSNTISIRR